MAVSIKRVKGHEYLYFSYYDRESRTKKEVYLGPKDSSRAIEKALLYSKEFLDLQQSQIHLKYRKIEDLLMTLRAGGKNHRT